MTTVVYPITKAAILGADVDLLADTIKVILVDADYTYSAAHDFLNDVAAGARIGSAVTLTNKAVTLGVFTADDPTFTAVAAGDTVTGIIVYQHTGNEATSRLIAYTNRKADTTAISVATSNGNITLSWPSGRVLKI
jgi:hypothetical protein